MLQAKGAAKEKGIVEILKQEVVGKDLRPRAGMCQGRA